MQLEIFEPSLCCESGICGPEPDKALIDLQNLILLLKQSGVPTKRYAINQVPMAFVQNAVVSSFIKANGPGKLPLVLLDDEIIKSNGYPTFDELAAHLPGLKTIKPDNHILGIFS